MDFGTVIILFLLLLVAIYIAQFTFTVLAKKQQEVEITVAPAAVRGIVDSRFSKLTWSDAEGPGDINKRRRSMRERGPVVSVDIVTLPTGRTVAQVWMSGWRSEYGVAAYAASAHFAIRGLVARLGQG